MAHVCPWWIGYVLIGPWRKWLQNPEVILAPHISEGMTVLDVGPGMGFFTLDMARLVGSSGTVIAADVQQRMVDGLMQRAEKAGLRDRIRPVVCRNDTLESPEPADFALAFAVAHEAPDQKQFLQQVKSSLKPGGSVLIAEPKGHVSESRFESVMNDALAVGLELVNRPEIWRSRAALFRRPSSSREL